MGAARSSAAWTRFGARVVHAADRAVSAGGVRRARAAAPPSPRDARRVLAQPRRRERLGDPVGLADQQAAGDHRAARRSATPPAAPSRAAAARAGWRSRPAAGTALGRRSKRAHLELDAVGGGVVAGRLRRPPGRCRAPAPARSRAGRRDRQHARAAAEVDERPRGGSAARAAAPGTAAWSRGRRSRTPGPGRSRGRSAGRRRLPRRAHGQPVRRAPAAGGTRRQRSAQSSATSVGDDLDQRAAGGGLRSGSAGSSPGAP